MKIRYYVVFFIALLFIPLAAADELSADERATIEAKFEPLSIDDFKKAYIDANKPFDVIEYAGDRRNLYKKWVKKNGPHIPLYLWTLLEEGVPKDETASAECEMCGHTELGTLNRASHLSLEDPSEVLLRFIGNRCITYATKSLEDLYADYIASLPDAKKKALTSAGEKKRLEQDRVLTHADRALPVARRARVEEDSSDDEETRAAHRRASLRKRPRLATNPDSEEVSHGAGRALEEDSDESPRVLRRLRRPASDAYAAPSSSLPRAAAPTRSMDRPGAVVLTGGRIRRSNAMVPPSIAEESRALDPRVEDREAAVEMPSLAPTVPYTPESESRGELTATFSRYASAASVALDLSIGRPSLSTDPLSGWQRNPKGNYVKGTATIFFKGGFWKYVLDGKFSAARYPSAEEAAKAFSKEYKD